MLAGRVCQSLAVPSGQITRTSASVAAPSPKCAGPSGAARMTAAHGDLPPLDHLAEAHLDPGADGVAVGAGWCRSTVSQLAEQGRCCARSRPGRCGSPPPDPAAPSAFKSTTAAPRACSIDATPALSPASTKLPSAVCSSRLLGSCMREIRHLADIALGHEQIGPARRCSHPRTGRASRSRGADRRRCRGGARWRPWQRRCRRISDKRALAASVLARLCSLLSAIEVRK